MKRVSIYRHDFEYAKANNETEQYRASSEADRACAQAIDKAVQDSNFQLYHYDLPTAARTVIKEHGAERVQNVLAHILRHYDWDGRLSANNKEWAKGFDLPRLSRPIVVNTHLAVLDGFINEVRKAVMEKALQPVQPGGTPGEYKYYATSRPIDIGTLPRKPKPESVVNFDSKRYVEDRTFAAWGYACYSEPLTKRQLSHYELRGAASNPPERASVVEHLKSGRQEAQQAKPPQPERGKKREAEI